MANLKLHSEKRDKKPKAPHLRQSGFIPATIYGHNRPSESLKIETAAFLGIYKQAGQTSLIDLTIGDESETRPVLIHQLQRNPLTDQITHIEFYRVRLTEKITTNIPLEIVGEAPAIKLGGIPFQNLQEIEVECFPQDLVSKIEVDIAGLEEINDEIFVKNLEIPPKLTLVTDPGELVFKILLRQEEEEEEEEETAEETILSEEATPEVITEKETEEQSEE